MSWLFKWINKLKIRRLEKMRKTCIKQAFDALRNLTPAEACGVFAEYCGASADELDRIIKVDCEDVADVYVTIRDSLDIVNENASQFASYFHHMHGRLDDRLISVGLGDINTYNYYDASMIDEIRYKQEVERAEMIEDKADFFGRAK